MTEGFRQTRRRTVLGSEPGAHILLDPDTGEINIYNADNVLIASLDPTGLSLFTDQDERYVLVRAGDAFNDPGLYLQPGDAGWDPGKVYLEQASGANGLQLTAPREGAFPAAAVTLTSEGNLTPQTTARIDAVQTEYGRDLISTDGGTFPGMSWGRGVIKNSYVDTPSAVISVLTDQAVMTLANVDFEAGRTYGFRVTGAVSKPVGSTATRAKLTVYVAGNNRGTYGWVALPEANVNYPIDLELYLSCPASFNSTVTLGLASNVAGQGVQHWATATNYRGYAIRDTGPSSNINAPTMP